jgi:murein DD-endopeptidase MepM/ murein hydrolase activator NlpD
VNEGHASGHTPDYDAYGYDPYSTGSYQTVGTAFPDDTATGAYAFIPQQQQPQSYEQGYGYGHGSGYMQPEASYAPAAAQPPSWDTGGYAAYDPYATGTFAQTAAPTAAGTGLYYGTGTYEDFRYFPQEEPQSPQQQAGTQDWGSGAYPVYGYGYDASGDTGVYEVPTPYENPSPYATQQFTALAHEVRETAEHDAGLRPVPGLDGNAPDGAGLQDPRAQGDGVLHEDGPDDDVFGTAAFRDDADLRHDYASDGFAVDGDPVARSRRRRPARRSALLTVAVPSVAVMGVAAVGAAAVTGVGMAQDSSRTQADAVTGTAPTTQLDRQLAGVSRDADDFADRASRSQERLDLKTRQEAAKKAAEEAAARKEALRPKFVLPVKQKGLSAYFGQAGVNWMALHTGIDFPVQVGTPVMAATDGTVRTQWNPSYGNMAIVTAPDGTETWYCHLSSTRIRSGKVKAGTVIAYSGNTGNTTGPHLHFEVRPHGGSPIDPLPWLLAHGLDPR